jgi:hypothetical protein
MTPTLRPSSLDERTTFERTFSALGFDSQLVDAILGDLIEQFEARAEEQGSVRARLWFARQMLRSAPHLFVAAARRGSLRTRAVLAVFAGLLFVALAGTVAFVIMRDGPPVQLVSDLSDDAGNVVLNNTQPVRIGVRALDRRGHVLDESVHYQWIAGTPIEVSADGALKCAERGDAVVRATVGTMAKNLAIRCRPVRWIRSASWMDLMVGGDARELPFVGVDPDDNPVDLVRGIVRVADSTVATLNGMMVRPINVGMTWVEMKIGDRKNGIRVIVNEPVTSFEHLRRDQRFVAREVRLAQGDTVLWALPRGRFWLKYIVEHAGDAPPTITLDGRAVCELSNPIKVYRVTQDVFGTQCTVDGPAAVKLAHGRVGAPVVNGRLVLEIQ